MLTIRLICHVERCPHNDSADGSSLAFSLNVCAGLEDRDLPTKPAELQAIIDEFLRPWLWEWDAGTKPAPRFAVAACVPETQQAPEKWVSVPFTPGAAYALASAAKKTWEEELQGRLRKVATADPRKENFVWPPAGGIDVDYDGDAPEKFEGTNAIPSVRQWTVEQTQIFVEPAPLPHAAQFTRHFWVKTADLPKGATQLAAAPIFAFKAGGDLREPAGPPAPPSGKEAELAWPYKDLVDGAGNVIAPAVVAFLNRELIAPGKAWETNGLWEGGWVDLKDAVFSEDWLAELEERVADLFDLPGLIVRFIGQLEAKADREAATEALREVFKVALRDLVQTGATGGSRIFPGAARPSAGAPKLATEMGLAGDVMRAIARQVGKLKDGKVAADFLQGAELVLDALHRWETDPAASGNWWSGVLSRAWQAPLEVTKQAKISELQDFAVLRRWHSYVVDEQTARELVIEQWSDLAAKFQVEKPEGKWWLAYRENLRRIFSSLPVRQIQAVMHLGVCWPEIVADIGRAPGERRTLEVIRTKVSAALTKQLVLYLDDRARAGGSKVFTDLPEAAPSTGDFPLWKSEFEKWLKTHVATVVVEKIFAGGAKRDELGPALQPDAVVLQLADISGAMDPVDDPLDGIAGFGVLLHEEGQPDSAVACLTLADVHLTAEPNFIPGRKPENAVRIGLAVVPVRPTERNGVRRALVSYNNEPLTAESPSLHLAQNYPLYAEETLTGEHHVRLFNPYGKSLPLPGLRFGADYSVAAFVVGVGGTLPNDIADPADRTKYLAPKKRSKIKRWQEFPYRRRVAIGELRIKTGVHTAGKIGADRDLPSIPASVHPLARSLRELAEARMAALDPAMEPDALTAARVAALGQSAEEFAQSLVLLRPPSNPSKEDEKGRKWDSSAAKDFCFEIRRPSIDLRVWDRTFRFVDAVPAPKLERSREQRSKVWRETFESFKDNPGASPDADAMIDDPAVEKILVRLTCLFPAPAAGAAPVTVTKVINFAQATGQGGLDGERAPAVKAKILSVDASDPLTRAILAPTEPDPDNPGGPDPDCLRIKVREGEVWLAELAPLAPAQPYAAWFQENLWNFTLTPWVEGGVEFRAGKGTRFIVEVATAALPASADLHAALRARAVAGGTLGPVREMWTDERLVWRERAGLEALRAGWRSEVALDPTVLFDDDLYKAHEKRERFNWVHRVSVLMQRWRWNGRPLRDAVPAGEPAEPAAAPWTPEAFFAAWLEENDAQLETWDGRLFGDRAGTDYRRHEATADFVAGGGLGAGAARVFHQDISQDPGAVYFRYAVQARSRYEGLLRHAPVESREGRKESDQVPEAWRRLVVPCRFDKEIPPPRLKLILPLTETRMPGAGEATPGLLVVLSEPWFLYGGLAEELGVEVAVAEEPVRFDPPSPEPLRRAELGADPIVAGTPKPAIIVPPGDSFPDAYSFAPLPAYGPIGHTFDTDTLAPEFIHTSYIVPAPELRAIAELAGAPPDSQHPEVRDLGWYFIKLRLRRRLEPAGLALPLARVESEPTAGVWAQFLPPSSRFATSDPAAPAADATALSLRHDAARKRWYFATEKKPNEPVPLLPTVVTQGEPNGSKTITDPATADDRARFQLWALLTEPLYDAFGRRTQERFVDFCPVEAGVLALKNKAVAPETLLRARLVEVQALPGQGLDLPKKTAQEVLEFLFPHDPEHLKEARARCVRVSAPIEKD